VTFLRSMKTATLGLALGLATVLTPLQATAQDDAPAFDTLPVQNASTVGSGDASGGTPVATPETGDELTGYIVGDPEAPVTLQIYADYQCPHCRNFYNTIEPQLVEDYVATGQVKLELLDFTVVGVPSFNAMPDDSLESVQAAEAAMCAAEQDGFLAYYQTLFTGEVDPNSGAFSDDNLKAFAEELGLDTAHFDECLDSGKYEDAIIAYVAQGIERGVPGTPSLSINGEEIFSVGDYSELQEILDAELDQ
jgi:protein-disulfide isomerase